MNNTKIKVCGITTTKLAEQTAQAGADYIGIVLHPDSPRYVDEKTAIAISQAAQAAGSQPVLVVVNHSAEEINAICKQTKINMVQLHSSQAHEQANQLNPEIIRIFAIALEPELYLNSPDSLRSFGLQFSPSRDFILYDNAKPGSGKFHLSLNNHPDKQQLIKTFIAGGLTPDNVATVIKHYQPYGVDVSSGVESQRGVKDINLIKQFIARVQSC